MYHLPLTKANNDSVATLAGVGQAPVGVTRSGTVFYVLEWRWRIGGFSC